jgi:hypothetical protein
LQIPEVVCNLFEWIVNWDAMEDTDLTFGSLIGNVFDTASLVGRFGPLCPGRFRN